MKNAVTCEQIPIDKLAQLALMNRNSGVVRIQTSRYSDSYQIDYVDLAPLPSEYEDDAGNQNDESNGLGVSADDAVLLRKAICVLAPLLEEIIAAGRIASRWTRANANKSLYFKIHRLYSTEENSGTTLAEQMNRPRPIPQRYAQKYALKKAACCTAVRKALVQKLIGNELSIRAKTNSLQDAVLDLYRDLQGFLTALVKACPWDSYAPFEICAEVYACNPQSSKHRKARRLLEDEGCTTGQIDDVLSLIAKFKEMEVSHAAS